MTKYLAMGLTHACTYDMLFTQHACTERRYKLLDISTKIYWGTEWPSGLKRRF